MDHHEDADSSDDDITDPGHEPTDDGDGTGDGLDGRGDIDPPVLDDAFVAGATIHEPSASERLDAPGPYGFPGGAIGGQGIGFEPTRVFITTSRQHPDEDQGSDGHDTEPWGEAGHTYGPDHGGDFADEDEFLRQRSARRRRRRGRTVKVLALLVVLATFVVYGLDHFVTGIQLLPWTRMNRALSGNEAPDGDTAVTPADGDLSDDDMARSGDVQEEVRITRGDNWPPAPAEPSTDRVLPPVVATTTGPHEFIMTQDDEVSPVAYDPCRPIRYVISGASKAPLEGKQLIEESLAEVTRVTGLAFVDEGVTTERPSDQRRSYQPNRYGSRWAPVLIAWSDPTESPRLAENPPELGSNDMDILGYAGSSAVGLRTVEPEGPQGALSDTTAGETDLDRMIFVTGAVTLDGPDFASLLQTPGGYEIARAAIMHEFAHLVGLAHIDDPTQLLFPALQPNVHDFAGGDLEGLAALGAGRCMPEI